MDRIWLDPVTGPAGAAARYIDVMPGRHFTVVTLDRDGLVYRARSGGRPEEAELRPGFANAIKRYQGAVAEYLWVHSYRGSFLHGVGPAVIRLPTPFHLADRVAAALRDAELHGDFTDLETLTADLVRAVPLGAWLAPGERLLRRGTDFTVAPSAFLEYLRARASKRGLRLNGRAGPGGVWVRPTMPRQNQELRRQQPDLFPDFVDPTPYAAHADTDDAQVRPYLDQPRTAQAASDPVRWLPNTLKLPRERGCPCGYRVGEDDPGHQAAHMQWSTGLPVPRNVLWSGADIAVVTATSPIRMRKLAHQCAVLPRRENGYDFPSFAVGDGTPDDDNNRAYLYRHHRRIIGFVSVFDSDQASWYPFRQGPAQGFEDEPHPSSRPKRPAAVPRHGDGTPRPVVNVMFTAQIWRRHGVARELVRAIAADVGISPSEVAWNTPFSEAGRALAVDVEPTGSWVI